MFKMILHHVIIRETKKCYYERRRSFVKKLLVFVLTLFCVLGLVGCGNSLEVNSEASIPNGGDDLPKGLLPMVMVNGKLYHWTGLSKEFRFHDSEVYTMGDNSTILPDGYNSVGEISGITEEVPFEELQLRAGFEATGTIFINKQTPEVIYVLMSTSWFRDTYIRFVSDDLHDNECISYQGMQYRFSIDIDICENLEELPDECVMIGTLKYIGSDNIPLNDLETNCITDGSGKFLDGREVYVDPNDHSILYVYEHQYWRQGDYPAWRVCRLWTEWME